MINIFGTTPGNSDVHFDAVREVRVCAADELEHRSTRVPPIWIDAAGICHYTPAMDTLPPLLKLGIGRMQRIVSGALHDELDAVEAVNILLTVLLPRLAPCEIDQRAYHEKRQFALRWCDRQ